jgi:hypothetical protein
MKLITYELDVPEDLLNEVKEVANETGLSVADVMRRAIKFGVPRVRRGASSEEDFAEAGADTWEKLGPPPGWI